MTDALIALFLLSGATLMVLAAIGVLRLPDLPTRMHASTKAAALGAMLIMAAVGLHFAQGVVWARVLAIVLFILITAPIAAHVIARAAYLTGVSLWDRTVKDELRSHYDAVRRGEQDRR